MGMVVIADSVRTGLAKAFRGSFNLTRPENLAAHCINALLERTPGLDPARVDDVVIGAARQSGEQANNLARLAGLMSGLPVTVSGLTISRACSSGLNAISIAATQIASGYADIVIAGGVESVSALQRNPVAEVERNPDVLAAAPDIYMAMGNTAEVVAKRYNVSREAQDEFSLLSQQRTAAAQSRSLFDDEIVPMTVPYKRLVDKQTGETEIVETTISSDECNRPNTALEGLAQLPPAFEEGGTVTAGNASQLADGASMTLLMSEETALAMGISPLGYFHGFAVEGCEPDEMGIGPVFAVPKMLKFAGLSMRDIDLVELNEAFASQCLYSRDRLEIDPEIYNVNGGSISIGHPFGMTGSRLTGHILRELRRRNQKYGLVSMCIGGGMGGAGLVEAISG